MQLTQSPPPLPNHTVVLVLDYLHPALSLPLPSHLLSTSLTQRHHFLNLGPDDPQTYLSWPSSTTAVDDNTPGPTTLDVLAALPPRGDDGGVLPYPIRYTADGETAYAHVLAEVPSLHKTLRLVFQWDGSDAWKYHDMSIASLPPSDFGTPSEAMAAATAAVSASTPLPSPSPFDRRGPSDGGDNDDYWDSYGGGDEDHDREHARPTFSRDGSTQGEDAYWAQYNSVHGTADSTIPSPAPEKKRRPNPYAYDESGQASPRFGEGGHGGDDDGDGGGGGENEPSSGRSSRSDHPLPIPPQNAFRARMRQEEGAPPSPNTLRTLLEAIPRRPSAGVTTLGLGVGGGGTAGEAAETEGDDPPALTDAIADPSVLGTVPVVSRPREDSIQTTRPFSPSLPPASVPSSTAEPAPALPPPVASSEDLGLKQAIAGLYNLWKAGRQARAGYSGDVSSEEAFLQVVRAAIN